MRGAFFWTMSTVLAFAITATVFLVLAELGTAPPEQSLNAGDDRQPNPSRPLNLDLEQSTLESLEEAEDQPLVVTLSNGSDRALTDINVYLILASEDTADQQTRYYEADIQRLASGESKRARFELDLSPPTTSGSGEEPGNRESDNEESFNILEIRAASSEGVSTVNTAVFAF